MTRTDTTVVGALRRAARADRGPRRHPRPHRDHGRRHRRPAPRMRPRAPTARAWSGIPPRSARSTARTQADRDLVALVFSGLVRNGPNGTIVPDLARRWTVDATGKTWTFHLRPDARWHDGEPVTAEDVVYTIQTLQDPAYTGPASSSWSEVSVEALSPARGDVHAQDAARRVPAGRDPADRPGPPARRASRSDLLPDHPFGRQPVGSGPFAAVTLDDAHAKLVPAEAVQPTAEASADPSALADRFAHDGATDRPPGAADAVPRGDRADVLRRRPTSSSPPTGRGTSTRRPACRRRWRRTWPRRPTAGSCATRARPSRPSCSTCARRTPSSATRRCGRRCSRRSTAPRSSSRSTPAPRSWRRIPSRRPRRCSMRRPIRLVPFVTRRSRRRRSRPRAGRRRTTAGTSPLRRRRWPSRSLSPDKASNPVAFAVAAAVVKDWKAIGLDARPRGAARGRVRDGAAPERDVLDGRDRRDDRSRPGPLPAARLQPDADRRLERHRRSRIRRSTSCSSRPGRPARRPPARRPIRPSRRRSRPADTCFRSPSRTRPSWSATRSRDPLRGRSPTRLIDFGMC